VPFVILIILNGILITFFRRYFKNKRNLLHASRTNGMSNISSTTTARNRQTMNTQITSNRVNINNSERKQIIVTILICLLSIIESLLLCLLFIARQRPMLLSFYLLSFLINLYQSLRYFSNYFIFLAFDPIFKKTNRIFHSSQ
jgi:hypothetical protein